MYILSWRWRLKQILLIHSKMSVNVFFFQNTEDLLHQDINKEFSKYPCGISQWLLVCVFFLE